jgi:RES domain-containing protein
MLVWRLCSSRYPALTGEGARLVGGRWNRKGTRVVYCSGSLALAALESFVHFDSSLLPDDYVAIAISIPDDVEIEEVDVATLPADWKSTPGPEVLMDIGSEWAASKRTLLLAVPSAVIGQERNYLVNPDHPDFSRLSVAPPQPFAFDSRMTKEVPAPPFLKKKSAPKKKPSTSPKKRKGTASERGSGGRASKRGAGRKGSR